MAKSSAKMFEEMISQVDRLPNDMPQDYKYRKRKNDAKGAESERAPVKLQQPHAVNSKVDSKTKSVVNNLMETNNRFQTTQNTIIQQQTEVNKDQLAEDRAQTDLLQQQHRTMRDMNQTMERMYLMLKAQNDKLNPKIQQRAANDSKAYDPDAGKPKDDSVLDSIGGLIGGALDLLGGGRGRRGRDRDKREPNKPKRQQRADERMRNRGGGRAGRVGGFIGSAGELFQRAKAGGAGAFARLRGAGKAAMEGMRSAGGNRYAKVAAAAVAGGAALWTGKKMLEGDLGSISEKYESGGRGVDTVSKGTGDHGGVSYGKHQLSSKSGTMQKFVNSPENEKFAQYFEGLTPGSAQFNAVYSQLAKERGEEFGFAQQNFIRRTHYDPAMRKLQDNGIDFSGRSRALNELVFSTATQYGPGGAPSKIMRALRGMDVNSMSDAEIITAIQDNKAANTHIDFKSSSVETQQSITGRAGREKADLLAMLQAEQDEREGRDREEVERLRKAAEKSDVVTTEDLTADAAPSTTQPDATVMPSQPVGVLPIAAPAESSGIDPVTGLATGGLLAGAAAATAARVKSKRSGATIADPAAIKGKIEATPGTKAVVAGEKQVGEEILEAGTKTAGKAAGKGLVKGVPVIGPVLTAADAAMILTDDSLSKEEKMREGAGLAGGTAGALAGGKAGAAGGAAVGAGIGAFFFGAGAVPGAAIGGIIGGIGGSVAGYFGGEYLGKEAYDAMTEEDAPVVQTATNTDLKKNTTVPEQPVGIFPLAKSVDKAPVSSPLVQAAKAVEPKPALPVTDNQSELAVNQLKDNKPQAVDLQAGKTTLMVVPVPMPAKVDTESAKSTVAETPVKTEPVTQAAPTSVTVDSKPIMHAMGEVAKAPAALVNTVNGVTSSAADMMVNSANAVANAANNTANNVVSSVKPSVQHTPAPKHTAASWSGVASATPQRVESVAAQHDTPMAREAFTSVQNVNVDNQQPSPVMGSPERIKSKGIAESNSVRPELKDVPPMISDFGITFINAGII